MTDLAAAEETQHDVQERLDAATKELEAVRIQAVCATHTATSHMYCLYCLGQAYFAIHLDH